MMTFLETILEPWIQRKAESPRPAQQKEQPPQTIPVDYLRRLRTVAGAERAIEVGIVYTPDDLLAGDAIVEAMGFPNTPTDGRERLELSIRALELDKQTWMGQSTKGTIATMTEYWSKVPLSFDGLTEVVNLMTAAGKEKDWYALRDVVLDSASRVLESYGVDFTNAPEQQGLFGGVYHGAIKVLPNTSIREFVQAVLQARAESSTFSSMNIVEGFDNWQTAVEFAKRNERNYEHVILGMTTMEAVRTIAHEDAKLVLETFGNTAKDYINRDIARFNDLLAKARGETAGEYFNALQGDFAQFNAIMERKDAPPSPMAIMYVRRNFNPKDLDETLTLAARIDSDDATTFGIPADSVDGFLRTRGEFLAAKAQFEAVTGGNAVAFTFDRYTVLKQYDGDPRFFRYISLGFGEEAANHLALARKIGAAMTFEEFAAMGINPFESTVVENVIPTLIDRGYAKRDIHDIITGSKDRHRGLKQFIDGLGEVKMPGEEIAWLYNADMFGHQVAVYVKRGIVGEHALPYSLIPTMQKHDMQIADLAMFIDTMGVGQYWKQEEGQPRRFDAIGFIRDYRVFVNKDAAGHIEEIAKRA